MTLNHTSELYDLTNLNREYLKKWLPWLNSIKCKENTKKFIELSLINFSNKTAYTYVILFETKICGVIEFYKINKKENVASLGYWLSEEFTGKGIVSKAVNDLLVIGFSELKLNKIEISCAEKNIKSRAVAKRLGFSYEKTIKDAEWLYTKYVNHVIYSLNQNDLINS